MHGGRCWYSVYSGVDQTFYASFHRTLQRISYPTPTFQSAPDLRRCARTLTWPHLLCLEPPTMPKSHTRIAAPLRNALLECFRAITRLALREQRYRLILIGGAASIAHSSVLKIEDVDVAAPPSILIQVWEAISAGALSFHLESDGKIAFDSPRGISVGVDLLELGGDPIERTHTTQPLYDGCVASKSDLLLLSAVTVVERGSDGEKEDFRWLVAEMAKEVVLLPGFCQDEREYMRRSAESCLGRLERLVLGSVLGASDSAIALDFIIS